MNNTFDTGSMAEEGDQGCFSVLSLMAPGELMLLFNQYVKGTSRKKTLLALLLSTSIIILWVFEERQGGVSTDIPIIHHVFMSKKDWPFLWLVLLLCVSENKEAGEQKQNTKFLFLCRQILFFQKSSSFHKEPFLYKDLVCVSVYVCVNSYEYVLFVVEV